jgi:SUR7/PalI family protein
MIRPATPLSVLLFAAFALLLLSVLSTPIITAIPLSSFDGVDFGVFGHCKDGGSCTGIQIGYDVCAFQPLSLAPSALAAQSK